MWLSATLHGMSFAPRCHRTGCCPVLMGVRRKRAKEDVMRVLVAGATGAMGRQLVPRLVRAGHEVHGMTRSESKQALLKELGAVPVVADALDPEQVARAVATASPEVVVHELTSIGPMDMRHFDRAFAQTNRLRTEGTDHLLSAARSAPCRRPGWSRPWAPSATSRTRCSPPRGRRASC